MNHRRSTGPVKSAILLQLIWLPAFLSAAPPASETGAKFGSFGLDLTAQDTAVRPGDDFFKYANGKWLASATIPPDRSRWGTFDELATEAEERVRGLIQSLPRNARPGSLEQKVGDYYRAYLDTDAIEKAGLAPARPALAAIDKAASHADIARLMGEPRLGLASPIGIGISIDEKNPDRYIIGIGQSGLSLPDRDYYLKDEQTFTDLRQKLTAHVERMLELAQQPHAAEQAKAILALETQIAERHWPAEKRRERELTYNLRTRKQLDQLAPQYPWKETLTAAGYNGQAEFVVGELSAVEALARHFTTVPVDTWKSYLKYHYLVRVADVLPSAFDQENFAFYGRTLNGQPQQRERWKRAVNATGAALGEAVGQLYVQRYFPPQAKQQMVELVENLRKAYVNRINGLTWMTAETKKVALQKLGTFRPKIAYPDVWRDYSKFEVEAGDAFGNDGRAMLFEYNRQLACLGKPTDREEWGMTPQTVNAYYNPVFNEIVFPAAILQAPFFDPKADAAVNYGAIGAVIGHEMGHGFDDQGAKSDAKGVLRTWWRPEDEKAFKAMGDLLVEQYDQYEPLPGLKVKGRFTLGENIGDLGGLTVAYEAYRLSQKGKAPPALDGLSGDQRFFLSWAQCWRTLMREEKLRNQVMSDTHSPPQFRVNGVVRNIDAWYVAFGVKPGDRLYLPPEERVRIW